METSLLFQSTSCIITPKLHICIVSIMLGVGSQKAAIKNILKFKLQSLFGELSVLVEGFPIT